MKPLMFLLCVLCLAGLASAGDVPYPLDVDSQARIAPAFQMYQASPRPIRVFFKDGGTPSAITGRVPFFAWVPTNVPAQGCVTATASIVSLSTGVVDFTFTAADLNTNGTFAYEVGLTTNSTPIVHKRGTMTILYAGYPAGVGTLSWSYWSTNGLVPTNDPIYIAALTNASISGGTTNQVAITSRWGRFTVRTNFAELADVILATNAKVAAARYSDTANLASNLLGIAPVSSSAWVAAECTNAQGARTSAWAAVAAIASNALNIGTVPYATNSGTGSFATNAEWATSASNAIEATHATNANGAVTAAWSAVSAASSNLWGSQPQAFSNYAYAVATNSETLAYVAAVNQAQADIQSLANTGTVWMRVDGTIKMESALPMGGQAATNSAGMYLGLSLNAPGVGLNGTDVQVYGPLTPVIGSGAQLGSAASMWAGTYVTNVRDVLGSKTSAWAAASAIASGLSAGVVGNIATGSWADASALLATHANLTGQSAHGLGQLGTGSWADATALISTMMAESTNAFGELIIHTGLVGVAAHGLGDISTRSWADASALAASNAAVAAVAATNYTKAGNTAATNYTQAAATAGTNHTLAGDSASSNYAASVAASAAVAASNYAAGITRTNEFSWYVSEPTNAGVNAILGASPIMLRASTIQRIRGKVAGGSVTVALSTQKWDQLAAAAGTVSNFLATTTAGSTGMLVGVQADWVLVPIVTTATTASSNLYIWVQVTSP